MLEHGDIDGAVAFGHADALAKIANRFRRITAPANAGQRRHARIVPAGHMFLLDQLQQLTLAQHRVG